VSLSLTLSKNKKVKQYIKKKTHKSIILRFWVEGGVIFLCGLTLCSSVIQLSVCTILKKIIIRLKVYFLICFQNYLKTYLNQFHMVKLELKNFIWLN